ncbi:hypothetical protein DFS33DRAFT_1362995 [Desarmillaria ectypa]|nr:hypothetical protein DFS33DRAFT_1362995 [Desarmillaria ectypa]
MHHFVNECFLIILIAYPILLFLVNLYPHTVHLALALLLGLTVTSTLIVSAVVCLVLVLWGHTEKEEEVSYCRENELPSSENKLIPKGLV